MKKRFAFTLAEVLIVIGIIGMIAQMTIPTLMNNVSSQTIKTAAKKNLSVMEQALMMIKANGETLSGSCDNNHACLRNVFLQYFRYVKTCEPSLNSGCITSNVLHSGWENGASVVLNDGTQIVFYDYDAACTFTQAAMTGGACGEALIDLNGSKPPNAIDKDVMWIEFNNDAVKIGHSVMSDLVYN